MLFIAGVAAGIITVIVSAISWFGKVVLKEWGIN